MIIDATVQEHRTVDALADRSSHLSTDATSTARGLSPMMRDMAASYPSYLGHMIVSPTNPDIM